MNKIVLEHYPASKLPEELRAGMSDDALVSVTVEEEPIRRAPSTPEELREQIERARKTQKRPVSMEEAVKRIRELRDEWDY